MSDKRVIFGIALISTLILIGGAFLLIKTTTTPQVTASQNARAYVSDPTSFDWGNIPYSGDKATKSFTIENPGTDILRLYNVRV